MTIQRSKPRRGRHERLDAGEGLLPTRRAGICGHLEIQWAEAISDEEWDLYRKAMDALSSAGIEFMIGGGFALAAFIGRWRDTKDIDFYIHPSDRERTIEALARAGFVDYFSRLPYDRKWIYRSIQSEVIVDIIWSMANQRAQVDDEWFDRAAEITLRRKKLLVIPREEFLWCKLYILQRDHCDWTDLFNLLFACGPQLEWDHVLRRIDGDLLLLKGLLTVYSWLCPEEALKLPSSLWERLEVARPPVPATGCSTDRIRLLDTRRWFAALAKPEEKLEV